jgi:glycine/D-amino acid oxidase-like deaminating enzyme
MAEPGRRHQVAVVGAGLAGSLLALALARRGLSVALIAPATIPAATDWSYGGVAAAAAADWLELEQRHGSLGWHNSGLVLHGLPPPLQRLPPGLQARLALARRYGRVDTAQLRQALATVLAAADVQRLDYGVIKPPCPSSAGGWRLDLAGGPPRPSKAWSADQVVLAAGAGCRALWPALPERLRFSWAGAILVDPASLQPGLHHRGWLGQARRGRIVQPRHWRRLELEASAGALEHERWVVDAGLARQGEALMLGQISLVGPDLDPANPPDPTLMEARLRRGLAELDPRLAALAGTYRQVPVPFCLDGQPLAGPVDNAPGLWVFTGFSGSFSLVPQLAAVLAAQITAERSSGVVERSADRAARGHSAGHDGATPPASASA